MAAGNLIQGVRWIVDAAGRIVGYRNPTTDKDEDLQAAPVQSLVSGAGKFRRGSIRRHDALYGWFGAALGGTSFNKSSGLSVLLWTMTVKMELEATFHSVRLLWRNVAGNAVNNNKALVGVTETNDNSTSALMASPTIGGTTYQAIAGAGSINGWRAPTWGGSGTFNLAASVTGQQYNLSDETPLTSIARTDGGTRPLLLYRTVHDGSVDGNWAFAGSLGTTLRTPSAAMRNRTIAISQASSDGIATLSAGHALTQTAMDCYPVVRHTVPVLSVWSVGDSTDQNDGLVADKVSSWVYRACLDASTPSNPVVFANFGASSQGAATFLANTRAALAAGAPAPSVMVVSPLTVNDLTATPSARIVETMRYYAQESLRLARDYDVPVVIWRPLLPYNALNGAGDAFRVALNAEMSALAAQCGVMWISFSGIGDGASPKRWVLANGFEVAAGSFSIGKTYVIKTVGTTDFTAIGASANTVGTMFVSTGAGSGSGTAIDGIHENENVIASIMAPSLVPLLLAYAAQ